MIQERRWWEVGRFSQLGLQQWVVDGSHTQESSWGSGQEFRQQLARMLSWAWAAWMHTDASGSCLKFSRAELWGGEEPLVKTRSPHGSHTSSFFFTSMPWLRLSLLSILLSYLPPSSSNCSYISKSESKPASSRKPS